VIHPLRLMLQGMALNPEQYLQIAAAYEKAAMDHVVPPQHRKAFARKAEWFRMLAQVGSKRKVVGMPPRERHTGVPMLSAARHLFAWQSLPELKR
jgi:hypothetical protein